MAKNLIWNTLIWENIKQLFFFFLLLRVVVKPDLFICERRVKKIGIWKQIDENDRDRWMNRPLEEFKRNAMIEMCRLLQVGQVRNM